MRGQDVVKLLHSAGLAVKALTTNPVSTDDDTSSNQNISVDQQKETFTAAASSYFALVSSLDVRLRRHIYALEEADILPAEASSKESQTTLGVPVGLFSNGGGPAGPSSRQTGTGKGAITGGGLGSLDVGWLNSRNDHVGKEMEAELWDQAQRFVQKLEEEQTDEARRANNPNEGDQAMQLPQTPLASEQVERT